jgi:hypothetical protein
VAHRREVTQAVIDLLPGTVDLDEAMRTWYYNLRSSGGFRLTQAGYQALCSAAVNSWSIDIKFRDFTKPALLALDRRLRWPYYIDTRQKKLVLFSSRDAMMATLYGDIKLWIDSLGSQHNAVGNP